jgi:hypothetical protein
MEGRGNDVEIRNPQSSICGKELFAGREDRLWWMGSALPTRIHLALWPVAVLVQAMLDQA